MKTDDQNDFSEMRQKFEKALAVLFTEKQRAAYY